MDDGRQRLGDWALALGIAAVVCVVLPVVGDWISTTAGVVALVVGILGVRRYENGVEGRLWPAVAGVSLGALALLVVAIGWAAAHLGP